MSLRHAWPVSFSRRRWRRPARAWPFVTIALTGSIAMGKSTAAAMLRRMGFPVFDSDAEAHRLTGPKGSALPDIAASFPGVVTAAGLDRQALGQRVFADRQALARLEAILHPMIAGARTKFLQRAALRRARAVVLDVPLLFETGGAAGMDLIAVVTAPAFLQRQRALGRKGMSADRLKGILARQMADHTKRRQAALIVPSGLGKREALRRLQRLRHLDGHRSRGERES